MRCGARQHATGAHAPARLVVRAAGSVTLWQGGTQHAGRTRLYAWWSGQRVSHAVTCARVGRAAAAPISCDEELQRGFWAAVAAFKVIL